MRQKRPKTLADKLFRVCWISLVLFLSTSFFVPYIEKLEIHKRIVVGKLIALLPLTTVVFGIGSVIAWLVARKKSN